MSSPLIQAAESLARELHAGQTYGPEQPYSVHLEHVVAILGGIPDNDPSRDTIIAAGWLHDAIEDTRATAEILGESVGSEVTRIVEAVTDAPGASRKERKARTYPKIRLIGQSAILVKLADRLANIRASHSGPLQRPSKMKMYAEEHLTFFGALYRVDGSPEEEALWRELDTLLGLGLCH